MSTLGESERLAVQESEMRGVKSDISEIKASIKTLEDLAAKGGGAFNAILMIGGLIGWLAGIAAAFYAMLHH